MNELVSIKDDTSPTLLYTLDLKFKNLNTMTRQISNSNLSFKYIYEGNETRTTLVNTKPQQRRNNREKK